MKIGGRVGFDYLEELERNFKSIDFPIELALPWRYEYWLKIENQIDEVIEFFKDGPIEILSIHATQGKIFDKRFLRWGNLTLKIAKGLDIQDVTIHPNNSRKNRECF